MTNVEDQIVEGDEVDPRWTMHSQRHGNVTVICYTCREWVGQYVPTGKSCVSLIRCLLNSQLMPCKALAKLDDAELGTICNSLVSLQ